MKKIFLFILFCLSVCSMSAYDFLRAVKDEIPGGYNFWVYTPVDYFYSQEQTPVIIFLHGASLCGRNLNKVRRYGPLDAIVKGRDIDALTIVPQNPGGAWNPKKIMDMLDWVKKNYPCDSNRVYVLGMSLGGYGTMDVCATYPDRIAAGMALCGGCSYKDVSGLEGWQGYPIDIRLVEGCQSRYPCSRVLSEENLSVALLAQSIK